MSHSKKNTFILIIVFLATPLLAQKAINNVYSSEISTSEITKDLETYNEQIRGLSYEEVRKALLSEEVFKLTHEAVMNPKKQITNHAYEGKALADRIIFSGATEEEKLELWHVLLYVRMSHCLCYPAELFNMHPMIKQTPLSLFEEGWEPATMIRKEFTNKGTLVAAGWISTLIGIIAYFDAEIRYLPRTDRLKCALKWGLGTFSSFALYICVFYGIGYFIPGPKTESIDYFEAIEKNHFETITWLKDFLPQSILDGANKTQKELWKLTYRSGNKIDYKALKAHQEAFVDYFMDIKVFANVT